MMYQRDTHRHKWKQKALAALYITFILAHMGEIFLTLKHLEHAHDHKVKIEEGIKIPTHIPEESKIEFLRINRLHKVRD